MSYKNKRGYSVIALHNPKSDVNVGAAIRAVGCYDAAMMVVTGKRFGKTPTDTMKTYRHKPVLRVEDLHSAVPFDCIPIAVDIIEGAESLIDFVHPERAFYVFGAEDATLGKQITDWCKHTIYVPTNGCMNLAASVNVVLYDRMMKQLKKN